MNSQDKPDEIKSGNVFIDSGLARFPDWTINLSQIVKLEAESYDRDQWPQIKALALFILFVFITLVSVNFYAKVAILPLVVAGYFFYQFWLLRKQPKTDFHLGIILSSGGQVRLVSPKQLFVNQMREAFENEMVNMSKSGSTVINMSNFQVQHIDNKEGNIGGSITNQQ